MTEYVSALVSKCVFECLECVCLGERTNECRAGGHLREVKYLFMGDVSKKGRWNLTVKEGLALPKLGCGTSGMEVTLFLLSFSHHENRSQAQYERLVRQGDAGCLGLWPYFAVLCLLHGPSSYEEFTSLSSVAVRPHTAVLSPIHSQGELAFISMPSSL